MNAAQRVQELRAWLTDVSAAKVVPVLPCAGTADGPAAEVCQGNRIWKALQQFAVKCEAFSSEPSFVMLDEQAGVLLPTDEVRRTNAPAVTDEATARELDELVEDAAFVLFVPPGSSLPHSAVFKQRQAFDVLAGLNAAESERLAATLADMNWPRPASNDGPRLAGLLVLTPPTDPQALGWVPLLHQITAVKNGQCWAAPWPRTAWPTPAVPLEEQRYIPLPYRRRVLTDDELDRLLRLRQEALAKRAAATGQKRPAPREAEPFGPDLDEKGWLTEHAIPWRVNVDAFHTAAVEVAKQAGVPDAVVEGVLGAADE